VTYAPPPTVLPTPAVIGVHSPWSAYYAATADSAAAPITNTPIAGSALFVPFVVTTPATFTRGWWRSGIAADGTTTADVGIYGEDQTRLASTGAVVITTTSSILQSAAFTASVALSPGIYYMAFSASAGDTDAIFAYAGSLVRPRACGFLRQLSAHPLPSPATFAAWSATAIIPFFGVATTSFAI
jgi:hypothetical protein